LLRFWRRIGAKWDAREKIIFFSCFPGFPFKRETFPQARAREKKKLHALAAISAQDRRE